MTVGLDLQKVSTITCSCMQKCVCAKMHEKIRKNSNFKLENRLFLVFGLGEKKEIGVKKK